MRCSFDKISETFKYNRLTEQEAKVGKCEDEKIKKLKCKTGARYKSEGSHAAKDYTIKLLT